MRTRYGYSYVKYGRLAGRRVNDEGYYWSFCKPCGKRTEHGITEGCCICENKLK